LPVFSDDFLGIKVVRSRPGGGDERQELRWKMPAIEHPGSGFEGLMGVSRLRGLLVELEEDFVDVCRDDGVSWGAIGQLLDISGEAARKRHGPRRQAVESSLEWSGRL
jgi:hypothetical protein